MKLCTRGKRLIIGIFLIGFAALPAWAEQRGRHMGRGWHHYDVAEEVTLKGTVTDVKDVPCDDCGFTGTHLMLKTEGEPMEVMLGPTSFLKKQDLAIAKGDEIEVTGVKIKVDDETEILAREVKKGDQTLTLRDKSGRPMWAGTHHRRRHR